MRYKGKVKELNHNIISDPSYDETVACRYERKEINKEKLIMKKIKKRADKVICPMSNIINFITLYLR